MHPYASLCILLTHPYASLCILMHPSNASLCSLPSQVFPTPHYRRTQRDDATFLFHFAAPLSTFSGCTNSDGERASAEWQSRQGLEVTHRNLFFDDCHTRAMLGPSHRERDTLRRFSHWPLCSHSVQHCCLTDLHAPSLWLRC